MELSRIRVCKSKITKKCQANPGKSVLVQVSARLELSGLELLGLSSNYHPCFIGQVVHLLCIFTRDDENLGCNSLG